MLSAHILDLRSAQRIGCALLPDPSTISVHDFLIVQRPLIGNVTVLYTLNIFNSILTTHKHLKEDYDGLVVTISNSLIDIIQLLALLWMGYIFQNPCHPSALISG